MTWWSDMPTMTNGYSRIEGGSRMQSQLEWATSDPSVPWLYMEVPLKCCPRLFHGWWQWVPTNGGCGCRWLWRCYHHQGTLICNLWVSCTVTRLSRPTAFSQARFGAPLYCSWLQGVLRVCEGLSFLTGYLCINCWVTTDFRWSRGHHKKWAAQNLDLFVYYCEDPSCSRETRSGDVCNPMAGYGCGLPSNCLYASYFGGNLQIISI